MQQVVARLCDVGPDGASTFVSVGALNLTHRDGHAEPQPLVPGEPARAGAALVARWTQAVEWRQLRPRLWCSPAQEWCRPHRGHGRRRGESACQSRSGLIRTRS